MKGLHGKERAKLLESLSPAARKLALEVERLKARIIDDENERELIRKPLMDRLEIEQFFLKKRSRKKKRE